MNRRCWRRPISLVWLGLGLLVAAGRVLAGPDKPAIEITRIAAKASGGPTDVRLTLSAAVAPSTRIPPLE